MPDPADDIRRLQALRSRTARDVSISGLVEAFQQHAIKHHRKLGELIELWDELLPPDIVEATTLQGLRGGVLTVLTDSASVSFDLDRRLREGLLAELRRRYRGTLTRVKLQVGPAAPR